MPLTDSRISLSKTCVLEDSSSDVNIRNCTNCSRSAIQQSFMTKKIVLMKILVVEDHQDTLRWLQLHLADLGHEVFTASDLEEAETALNTQDCDVLISDISLPDGTGWDLMKRSPAPRRFVGIAMSGVGRNIDTTESFRAGYRHHLFKPFPLSYLDRLLEEVDAELTR
jgi:DNA-binding response OmpR family regulator